MLPLLLGLLAVHTRARATGLSRRSVSGGQVGAGDLIIGERRADDGVGVWRGAWSMTRHQ